MNANTHPIRVGTASWSEPEFVKAEWYPKGLPAAQQLPFYAARFDMVELNSSFYAIPQVRMCDRWARVTPDGFLFDVKCHRLLSRHATKADALPTDLRDAVELTDRENVILTPALEEEVAGRFLEALTPLERAGQLGALLLQMTPGFTPRSADLTALERSKGNPHVDGRLRRQVFFPTVAPARSRLPKARCVVPGRYGIRLCRRCHPIPVALPRAGQPRAGIPGRS